MAIGMYVVYIGSVHTYKTKVGDFHSFVHRCTIALVSMIYLVMTFLLDVPMYTVPVENTRYGFLDPVKNWHFYQYVFSANKLCI
jgi:hypothetical protein